jgi:AraC-like DNA-binding protein
MNIEFSVNHPKSWLKGIAEQIGIEIIDDTIHFPPTIGKGFLRHYYLSNGLTLNYLHCKFHEEMAFIRKEGKDTSYSPIIFYIQDKIYNQDLKNEIREICLESANGIFWPSFSIESRWKIPGNEWVSNLTITIDHEWLINQCQGERKEYLRKLLFENKSFYLFESITSEMQLLFPKIADIIENNKHEGISRLFLESKATELIALFIEKIFTRPLDEQIASLNTQDVEKIFKVKSQLIKNISRTPPLKQLAEEIGFSESKLQKTFKQVFGKSIYQYALQEKMLIAKKMLQSKQYTVSEVGYELGYSNLSHFTKAFRKQFGLYPRDIN